MLLKAKVDQVGQVPKDQVEESLREILSDSSYGDVSPDSTVAEKKAIEKFQEFRAWIEDLFDFMPASSLDFWLSLSVVILSLIGLALLGSKLYQRNRKFAFEEGYLDDQAFAGSLRQQLERARAQAVSEGAFTEALSLRFRLGLLAVSQRNPGRLRPGYTNRECLIAWSRVPEYRDRLAQVIDLLDRKWYAQEQCSPEEYTTAEAVLAEMGSHAN
ncbi:MAG: hypothetical protein P8N31_08845 [Planctomycetota bacterium]|nr:hypothetical protein [Planctomycetota bacterium]MDG2143648.1 hypothetical protein [Planctomycetota bacterium]